MSFPRAIAIAIMAAIMIRAPEFTPAVGLAAVAVGALLWLFTDDPLPKALDQALEDFARKHRRGGR